MVIILNYIYFTFFNSLFLASFPEKYGDKHDFTTVIEIVEKYQ